MKGSQQEDLWELAAERRWQEALANSGDLLKRLADEALAEHAAGLTQELDPERPRDLSTSS